MRSKRQIKRSKRRLDTIKKFERIKKQLQFITLKQAKIKAEEEAKIKAREEALEASEEELLEG
jgi:hypothetical protein